MLLPDYLRPGLRVVIAGVAPAGDWDGRRRYYAGRGNAFWRLLHESGLVPEPLTPADDERLPEYGVGLTDLAKTVTPEPGGGGAIVHYDVPALGAKVARSRRTRSRSSARPRRTRTPRAPGGPVPSNTARRPGRSAVVRASPPPATPSLAGAPPPLPGPSGANNGMHLPLRIALWRDLVDFLDTLQLHDRRGR